MRTIKSNFSVFLVLFFVGQLMALNFVTGAVNKLDNAVTYSIKSAADSRIVGKVCNFLLYVAKEVDSCESYKGLDWHDVAYREYLAGRNPGYPRVMAMLAFAQLTGFQDFRRAAAKPGQVEEQIHSDDFEKYKEYPATFRDSLAIIPLEHRAELTKNPNLPRDAIFQFLLAFGVDHTHYLLNGFINGMEYQEDWRKFILNLNEYSLSDMYELDQSIYGSVISNTVQMLAELIKANATYQQVSSFAAFGRSVMDTNPYSDKGHGDKRKSYNYFMDDGSQVTYMALLYEVSEERYGQLLESWKNIDSSLVSRKENLRRSELPGHLAYSFDDQKYTSITFNGKINGNLYPLNTLYSDENSLLYLTHTSTDVLERINYGTDHLSQLYDEALLISEEKMLIKKLGELFWWYCQIKPVFHGDPSIAEVMVKGALLAKGFQVPGWKQGLIPWVEVVLEPDPIKFGERFESYFDYSVQ